MLLLSDVRVSIERDGDPGARRGVSCAENRKRAGGGLPTRPEANPVEVRAAEILRPETLECSTDNL